MPRILAIGFIVDRLGLVGRGRIGLLSRAHPGYAKTRRSVLQAAHASPCRKVLPPRPA